MFSLFKKKKHNYPYPNKAFNRVMAYWIEPQHRILYNKTHTAIIGIEGFAKMLTPEHISSLLKLINTENHYTVSRAKTPDHPISAYAFYDNQDQIIEYCTIGSYRVNGKPTFSKLMQKGDLNLCALGKFRAFEDLIFADIKDAIVQAQQKKIEQDHLTKKFFSEVRALNNTPKSKNINEEDSKNTNR
ncbi:MAG: hypothetical protein GY810_09220 [Aureispira sp.]|nr:hypothetical protein [Aureispira sp.]